MPYALLISDLPYDIQAGSLTIDRTIGKVSSASFKVHTSTATHFRQFERVSIYDQAQVLAFSGYLYPPLKEVRPGRYLSLDHSLSCIGQEWLAKKRVVAATFTNKTCGYIAQWLVDNILAEEGVTVGQIYDGLTPSTTLYPSLTLYPGGNVGLIPQAIFGYCTVADALDQLVTQASAAGTPYYWAIDQYKQLWFVPYTAVVGPAIDGSVFDDGKFSGQAPYIQRQNPLYRNTQYETGGTDQTVTQTEIRLGDGNTKSWNMGYALSSVPTISTNLNGAGYVAKTVGIQGVETGKDFYWNEGSPTITQDSAGTALRGPTGTIDLLKVVYVGEVSSVSIATDPDAIAAQAALDGTSGKIEAVENDPSLSSASNALAKASALLTRYAVEGMVFVGNTQDASYAPGQLCPMDLSWHGITGKQAIVESVSASDQIDGLNIWYTVTAVSGPYDGTWIDFFTSLFKQVATAGNVSAGTTQSLVISQAFTAAISLSASFTPTISPAFIPGPTHYPGSSEYPG